MFAEALRLGPYRRMLVVPLAAGGGSAPPARAGFDPASVRWQVVRDADGIARVCAVAQEAGVCGLDVESAARPGAAAAGRWATYPAL